MTKQEASKEIATKVKEAMKILRECERIADDYGVNFDVNVSSDTRIQSYTPKDRDKLTEYPGTWDDGSGWDGSGC